MTRRCVVLVGNTVDTEAQARALVEGHEVLYVGDGGTPASQVRRLLGGAYDAVVLDLHGGVDADLIGRAHGFVRRGGALVLRMAPTGGLMQQRVVRCLGGDAGWSGDVSRETSGTSEQTSVVEMLAARLLDPTPSVTVLTADRGRGKSSALGLALAQVRRGSAAPVKVRVTAGDSGQTAEVLRFAPEDTEHETPRALLATDVEVLVVDEAATLPIPLLRALVRRHVGARIVFATTTRGYEGTGRGFALRFVEWLRARGAVAELSLEEPIRWDAGDALEARVFEVLLLDAEPHPVGDLSLAAVRHVALDRGALAADEGLLRGLFGLLMAAHYRTTPGDLQRLLEAPNVHVHALMHGESVVAATWVVEEGAWSEALTADVVAGRTRVRGQALTDTLVCHAARPDAAALRMVRSVRIAVHPALRRRGLGHRLIEAVHAAYDPDLFGTLFGATPELLAFRRGAGYRLVRVGTSRGARTGEPAAVMVRPVSAAARALVADLRGDVARELPTQLALFDDPLLVGGLSEALLAGLPAPRPAPSDAVATYLSGTRPFESMPTPLIEFAEARRAQLPSLSHVERAVIEARVLERRPWLEVAARAGVGIRASQRALRRAFRALASGSDAQRAAAPACAIGSSTE